jgi:radical SAM protein with 4Fe4S-binding SPASM domain
LAIDLLSNNGVTVNVHFILDSQSVNTAIEILKSPPDYMENANAIVFLNYKPVGRKADKSLLLNRSERVAEFFELATSTRQHFRVGFDTCTVTGLARLGKAPEISVEGCDAGRFSMFVSESMDAYPCSYMVETKYAGFPLSETSLGEIWRESSLFKSFRSKHAGGGCSSCTTQGQCLSGCPLFPEMNLCPENCA